MGFKLFTRWTSFSMVGMLVSSLLLILMGSGLYIELSALLLFFSISTVGGLFGMVATEHEKQ